MATKIVHDPDLQTFLTCISTLRAKSLSLLDLQLAREPSSPTSTPTDSDIQISRQQAQLVAYASQLKIQHRLATLSVRETKQQTADARSEVDSLNLQLQNLVYEQGHLRGEIRGCEEYEHSYTSLPLIPLEEFLELFPEKENLDEHELMLERIAHEHRERKALEEKRQGLLKRKQGMIAENIRRKEDLANLDKDLEKFIEAADPIIKTFEKEY